MPFIIKFVTLSMDIRVSVHENTTFAIAPLNISNNLLELMQAQRHAFSAST
jgi:hypothetical protein